MMQSVQSQIDKLTAQAADYEQKGNFKQAAQCFKQILSIDPQCVDAIASIRRLLITQETSSDELNLRQLMHSVHINGSTKLSDSVQNSLFEFILQGKEDSKLAIQILSKTSNISQVPSVDKWLKYFNSIQHVDYSLMQLLQQINQPELIQTLIFECTNNAVVVQLVSRNMNRAVLQWILQGRFNEILLEAQKQKLMQLALSAMYSAVGEQSENDALLEAVVKFYALQLDSSAEISLSLVKTCFQIDKEFGGTVFGKAVNLDQLLDCLEYETTDHQLKVVEMLSDACSNLQTLKKIVAADALGLYMKEVRHVAKKDSDLHSAVSVLDAKLQMGNTKDPLLSQASGIKEVTGEQDIHQLYESFVDAILDPQKSLSSLVSPIEGLAYISSKAPIKERIVNNLNLIQKLFKLMVDASQGATEQRVIVYGVCSVIASISAFKQKLTEEQEQMIKLRTFAKDMQAPVNDPLDEEPAVLQRIRVLIEAGVTSALTKIVKSVTEATKDVIACIMQQIATSFQHHGVLVSQGAVKTCLTLLADMPGKFTFTPISVETEGRFIRAANAISKLAITLDPSIAFRGQVMSLVKPMVYVSQSENELYQFESMMALTNLTSTSDAAVLTKVFDIGGIKAIDNLIFSDNVMVRRSAVECLCNMVNCDKVVQLYMNEKADRLKILIALTAAATDDDCDFKTLRAASGCLAILSTEKDICQMLVKSQHGLINVYGMLAHQSVEILHRALFIIRNIIGHRLLPDSQTQQLKNVLKEVGQEDQNVSAITEECLRLLK